MCLDSFAILLLKEYFSDRNGAFKLRSSHQIKFIINIFLFKQFYVVIAAKSYSSDN